MDQSVIVDSDGKKTPLKQVIRHSETKKNLKIKNHYILHCYRNVGIFPPNYAVLRSRTGYFS